MSAEKIEFEFEYLFDSSEEIRTITIKIVDDLERPYVDLSDEAYGKAVDKAEALHPGADIEMWSS